jgi:hypothetical protein
MQDAFRDPSINTNNIEIRSCPVISIDSITYTDYSGTVQTWPTSAYQVNITDEPCQIRYVWGGMWPVARIQEKSIAVNYHCGYAIPFTVTGTSTITLKGVAPTNGATYRVSNSWSAEGLPGGMDRYTDYYIVNASGQACGLATSANGSAITISGAGSGYHFLGEINPLAVQAIKLKVAANYCDREGAEYKTCMDGYWSKIHSLRYEGW